MLYISQHDIISKISNPHYTIQLGPYPHQRICKQKFAIIDNLKQMVSRTIQSSTCWICRSHHCPRPLIPLKYNLSLCQVEPSNRPPAKPVGPLLSKTSHTAQKQSQLVRLLHCSMVGIDKKGPFLLHIQSKFLDTVNNKLFISCRCGFK